MEAYDIIGYPMYEIFSDGRILSFKRCQEGRFLKPRISKTGYYVVDLCKNGKRKSLRIHRLLMQNFKPDEYDENLCVDHKNRIRTDNRMENLRMVTQEQNNQNQGEYKHNTSGHKNINWHKVSKGWEFQKRLNKLTYRKYFKTLEQAIEFKNVFCIIHNVERL
tara:strand:+ start:276 stop:764 length:489 start_codon:yes stop_codon:yes gene_type:complete